MATNNNPLRHLPYRAQAGVARHLNVDRGTAKIRLLEYNKEAWDALKKLYPDNPQILRQYSDIFGKPGAKKAAV
jgi:hypothetical protein